MLLTRTIYTNDAVYGYLRFPDGMVLTTVERPWYDNEPHISCVPEGTYQLVPHSTARFPDTWALVNHALGVAHQPTPGVRRSAILIHAANVADELEGCIAPGLFFDHFKIRNMERALGVGSSFDAMNKLRKAMRAQPQTEIRIEKLPWAR